MLKCLFVHGKVCVYMFPFFVVSRSQDVYIFLHCSFSMHFLLNFHSAADGGCQDEHHRSTGHDGH